jgi:uncharacterized protein YcsI (UPF0317 family)
MKMDHNRHDLAGGQLGASYTFDCALVQQCLTPRRLECLAEIIDMSE